VIHVSGFRKTYGSTVAVDDVSFRPSNGGGLGREFGLHRRTIETRGPSRR